MTYEFRETAVLGFNIAQIVVSVGLVLVLLFQVTGGGLGGIFGEPETVYRTRRGIAKTLFRSTILLAVAFVVLALAHVGLPVGEVAVSIDVQSKVPEYSDITAEVRVGKVPDSISAAMFTVSFDDSVLRLYDVEAGEVGDYAMELYTSSWKSNDSDTGKYTLVVTAPGLLYGQASPVTGPGGYLARLHFHVVGPVGSHSKIKLSDGSITDYSGETVEKRGAEWSGGRVKVIAPEAGVNVGVDAPAMVEKGDEFVAKVNMSEIADSVNKGQFTVTFDDTILELSDVTAGQIGDAQTTVLYSQKTDESGSPLSGQYAVVADVPDVTGVEGCLAELHFRVISTTAGDSSEITLSEGSLKYNDEERQSVWGGSTVSIRGWADVSISEAPSQASQDSTFTAKVNVSRVVNKIDRATFDVTFDESVLQLDDVTSGKMTHTDTKTGKAKEKDTEILSWTKSEEEPGKYTISVEANGDTDDSGDLAELHFRVVGAVDSTCDIGLANGVLRYGNVDRLAEWSGATVTVMEPASVSVEVPADVAEAESSDFVAKVNIAGIVNSVNEAEFDVSFNDSVLRLDDVTAGHVGESDTTIAKWTESKTQPGMYSVVVDFAGEADQTGSLAELHFHVVGNSGDSSAIDLSGGHLEYDDEELGSAWIGSSVVV